MSFWRYTPAIRIRPTAALTQPPALTVAAYGVGALPNQTWYYWVAAAFDGAGSRVATISSASAGVNVNAKEYVRVALPFHVQGARWYRVYRHTAATPVASARLVYSTSFRTELVYDSAGSATYTTDRVFEDRMITPYTETAPTIGSSGTVRTVDFRAASGTWGDPNAARVTALRYTDLSEPMESIQRKKVAREFGVRASVDMVFSVTAGSIEEEDLAAIYGAKLAYPDGTLPGLKLDLTLNFDASNPVWREVRLIGDMSRIPMTKNTRLEIPWTFETVDPLPSVPTIESTLDGTGVW